MNLSITKGFQTYRTWELRAENQIPDGRAKKLEILSEKSFNIGSFSNKKIFNEIGIARSKFKMPFFWGGGDKKIFQIVDLSPFFLNLMPETY